MSVFVLGGKAKGFEIYLPPKILFRPTSVMLRRKLFDYQQNWEDRIFIDVCAGSGIMAFEALSRGASQIIINDQSLKQQKILQQVKNAWLEKYPEDNEKITISRFNALDLLLQLEMKKSMWIFFDPPYHDELLYKNFTKLLCSKNFISESGVIMELEQKKGKPLAWQEELRVFGADKNCRELQSSDRKLFIYEGRST